MGQHLHRRERERERERKREKERRAESGERRVGWVGGWVEGEGWRGVEMDKCARKGTAGDTPAACSHRCFCITTTVE